MAILTQNYRGARTVNSVYQNTSGYPLIVVAYETGNDGISVYSDASNPPTTQRWDSQGIPINTRGTSAIFIVQPSAYYKIVNASVLNVLEVAVGVGSISDSGNINGSRSLASNYQNTSGGAMLVTVTLLGAASPADLTVYSDNTSTPSATNKVWISHTASSAADSCAVIIPNGHYYRVECAGGIVSNWREYVLPFNVNKSDVTASRVLGTAYQNTGSDGMFISVVRFGAFASNGVRYFYSDTSNPPTTAEFFQQTSSSGVSESAGFALSSWYYATDAGPDSITKWWEYNIGSLSVGGRILQCAQP